MSKSPSRRIQSRCELLGECRLECRGTEKESTLTKCGHMSIPIPPPELGRKETHQQGLLHCVLDTLGDSGVSLHSGWAPMGHL